MGFPTGTFKRLVEEFVVDPAGIEASFASADDWEARMRKAVDARMNARFQDGDAIKGFTRMTLGGPSDVFWVKGGKGLSNYQLYTQYPTEVSSLLGVDRYNFPLE